MWRRPEWLVAAAALAAVAVPLAAAAGPRDAGEWAGAACMTAGAAALAGWRRHPLAVLLTGPALLLAPLFVGLQPSAPPPARPGWPAPGGG